MSLFDLMWNLDQEEKLNKNAETLEELNNKVEVLHEWVKYLHAELQRTRQILNIQAGAEVVSDDGGYSIGTQGEYDKFVAKRNESMKFE